MARPADVGAYCGPLTNTLQGASMAARILPPTEILRQKFVYHQDTGALYRGGKRAESFGANHYTVWICGANYLAHRVIFKMMTGDEPPSHIDHANRNKLDNRWANLRPASARKNGYNRPAQANSKTGVKGVSRRRNRYLARIKYPSGKYAHLGCYPTLEMAKNAYDKAAAAIHGEFLCNN